eukprot:8027234-Lingulodinium_polyedra.AAC.1
MKSAARAKLRGQVAELERLRSHGVLAPGCKSGHVPGRRGGGKRRSSRLARGAGGQPSVRAEGAGRRNPLYGGPLAKGGSWRPSEQH